MRRQPWYKEGRRPAKWLVCTKCGKNFRDDRSSEQALLQAIFGTCLCYECQDIEDTCTACVQPITKKQVPYYYMNQPYHRGCLPYA